VAALAIALSVVGVACSDGQPIGSDTTGSVAVPDPPGPGLGPTDCLEYVFDQANPDRTVCIFAGDIDGIALIYRPGERAEYEAGKGEAALTADVTEVDLCDVGYYIHLVDAFVLMEAWSETNGRVYGATVSGVGLERGRELAEALIETACA
jgi:hypothetical protein